MGAAYSGGRGYQPVPSSERPSRHNWNRVQDIDHTDSDDEEVEQPRWWSGDRRVFVEEKADWPRACPILHLNIHNDFPLEAQRSFIRSAYRFWLFSWWTTVINFIAVLTSLLTSNVTNPSEMLISFLTSTLYFFFVFTLWFRPLYWALRLESSTLFVWFYIFSILLVVYFVYSIGVALALVSIMAQPLAPGSQLPVKINPIFPVTLFAIVIVFFLFCAVLMIYYISTALKWQRMHDIEKFKLFKQQKKKKWLAPWFGGTDDDLEGLDDEEGKPRHTYDVILSYEKRLPNKKGRRRKSKGHHDSDDDDDDYNDGDGKENSRANRKGMRGKSRSTPPKNKQGGGDGEPDGEVLTVPGKLEIYPAQRKVVFRASEAIFNSIFKLPVMLVNVQSLLKKEETWMYLVENLHEGIDSDDRDAFYDVAATCTTKAATVRMLKFDFESKDHRNECHKNIDKIWRIVTKKKKLFLAEDEKTATEERRKQTARSAERAAQHLLTHKDWKTLVGCVWRRSYRAGEVLLEKNQLFDEIMYVASGQVEVYLETSESASKKLKEKETNMDEDDFDLKSALFGQMILEEAAIAHKALSSSYARNEVLPNGRELGDVVEPRMYAATFYRKNMGFSYRKRRRDYNLDWFINRPGAQQLPVANQKRFFPNNLAAVVEHVRSNSEAQRMGVRPRDEIVFVGGFDIEATDDYSQRQITQIIKRNALPLEIRFRRPPPVSFTEDARGFVDPVPSFVPDTVRETLIELNEEAEEINRRAATKQYVVPGFDGAQEEQQSLLQNAQPSAIELTTFATTPSSSAADTFFDGNYDTSDDEGDDEGDDDEKGASKGYAAVATRAFDGFGPQESPSQVSPYKPPPLPPPVGGANEDYVDVFSGLGSPGFGGAAGTAPFLPSGPPPPPPHPMHAVSSLDLAENYASSLQQPTATAEANAGDDHRIEFDAAAAVATDATGEPMTIRRLEIEHERAVRDRLPPEQPSLARRLVAHGSAILFGQPFEYDKVEASRIRKQIMPIGGEEGGDGGSDDGDEISIEIANSDDDSGSDDGSQIGDEDFFTGMKSFEPVSVLELGDIAGIVPWILNQKLSVVRLRAKTDVVVHSISYADFARMFRKNKTLALAFFKYVASVIGERADRDEERLINQIEDELTERALNKSPPGSLTRLLDRKPINTTEKTEHTRREEAFLKARALFETELDMEYDSIIDSFPCVLKIIGDISVLVGRSWSGVDTRVDSAYNQPKPGTLYLTHYHICFCTHKQVTELAKFKRRPTLYGKVHLNDIFNLIEDRNKIIVQTDDIRVELEFESDRTTVLVKDWIQAVLNTGQITERAPHSYTLPGDLYGLSSGTQDPDMPSSVSDDPLNIVYSQQQDLRKEFLIDTQTMQQVLTKSDRFKLFHNGRSVTLRKGQNVITASRECASDKHFNKDQDPAYARRAKTTKKTLSIDGPNGLYLVGQGELVVQREISGRRVQFASYKAGTVFGVERFLTGAPSVFTVKVSSQTCLLKFAPRDRCMALMRADLSLASRFYQYCSLLQMQRLRGPIISRPQNETDEVLARKVKDGSKGCTIL